MLSSTLGLYSPPRRGAIPALTTSRKVGNTRVVRANPISPYYAGLADVLTRAFGVPAVVAAALRDVEGIDGAYIYGSWAARHAGEPGSRPVGDIEVLVLGRPDRDQLFDALAGAEKRLGRRVKATIRTANRLKTGARSFHDTMTARPMLKLDI